MTDKDGKHASAASTQTPKQAVDVSSPETLTLEQQDKVKGGLGATERDRDEKLSAN